MTDTTLKEIVEELTQASQCRSPADIFEALGIYDDKIYQFQLMMLNQSIPKHCEEMPNAHDYAMSYMRDYVWFGDV